MQESDSDFLSVDELVLRFSGLVRTVAWRMTNRLPRSVEIDDLIQDGMLMLIQLRVSPDISESETAVFVMQRVRGAMVDALRALDPISRHTRRLARAIHLAEGQLRNELLRSPTHSEISHAAGIHLDLYFQVLRVISVGEHQSPDYEPEDEGADPVDRMLKRELSQCMADAMRMVWVPAGVMLAYYSEINLWYVAGFPADGLPGAIKTACANIITANANMMQLGNTRMYKAGDTAMERFAASNIDDDTKALLAPYRAKLYV